MKKMITVSFVLSLLVACANKEPSSNSLVQLGSSLLKKEHLEGYEKALRLFPTPLSQYFPGNKAAITKLVETEILSAKASHIKSALISGKDWQWKKQYFPAQMFVIDHLPQTLGFSETELMSYYNQNKEQFKKSVKDTTGKDSTYYQTFKEVNPQIAENLFYTKYPPDSSFRARFAQNATDTARVKSEWIQTIRSTLPQFFMKEYYKQEYGKPYPDSISEVYGKGKSITPEDMDVILSWIPEERRQYYKSESASRELVEWLLKWKLFSIQAKKTGFSETPAVKSVMDWAIKMETVNKYIETELVPKLQDGFKVDTQMVTYSMYDEGHSPDLSIEPKAITDKIDQLYQSYKRMRLDSVIYDLRKNAKITFLQADYRDERDQNPAAILKMADSLRDTGAVDEAEKKYTILVEDLLFSAEGKKALVELAKIQTERQIFQQAITNYRNYLLLTPDDGKRCNTFFMIGFIYDEHLNRSDNAEVNYKWILKNTPDCDLADDAEFMVLHLDEPMSSVEELRAEALRQGRKIDSFDDAVATQQDSVKADTTSKTN